MGSLFLVFEGTRKMLEFRRIFDECRRPREVQVRGVRAGGVVHLIGAPTSPLGLSPKIEEEEEKRREGVKVKMIFKDNIPGKWRKKVD